MEKKYKKWQFIGIGLAIVTPINVTLVIIYLNPIYAVIGILIGLLLGLILLNTYQKKIIDL